MSAERLDGASDPIGRTADTGVDQRPGVTVPDQEHVDGVAKGHSIDAVDPFGDAFNPTQFPLSKPGSRHRSRQSRAAPHGSDFRVGRSRIAQRQVNRPRAGTRNLSGGWEGGQDWGDRRVPRRGEHPQLTVIATLNFGFSARWRSAPVSGA